MIVNTINRRMSQKSCCIQDCNSSSSREQDRGVTFHRLPKEGKLRQAWNVQGRLQDRIQTPVEEDASSPSCKLNVYICSRHFRKVDFELKVDKTSKFVLKAGAIPTIFPWGITALEDLCRLYPDVDLNDEHYQPTARGKQSASQDWDGDREAASTSTPAPAPADRTTEDTHSSSTAESDKDGFEGELVIDESPTNLPQTAKRKRKRQRRPATGNKLTLKRIRKPKVMADSVDGQHLDKYLSSSDPHVGKPLQKKRASAKKRESDRSVGVGDGVSPQMCAEYGNKKPNIDKGSPMLRALIEKPNVPMVHPKVEQEQEIRVSHGNEKSFMVPGALVEAKDFSEQWYSAKIIEVDYDEKEVLIHYDNWSQRYDEWISMGSSRLRLVAPPQRCPRITTCPVTYSQGERCLARWSDNRRFPATIQAVLTDDKYQVLFDDGFVRVMKWQHLAKGQPSMEQATQISPLPYGSRRSAPALPAAPSTPPPPPLHTHLFDPHRDHLGSKEERRDKKRKINVKELFSSQGKRRRSDQLEMAASNKCRRKSKASTSLTGLPQADLPHPSPVAGLLFMHESSPSVAKQEDLDLVPEPSLGGQQEPELTCQLSDVQPEEMIKSELTERHTSEMHRLKDLLVGGSTSPKPLDSSEKKKALKQKLLSKVKKPRAKTTSPAPPGGVGVTVKKEEDESNKPEDLGRLLKDEWSCKWVDNQPVGEVTVLPPLERGTRAGHADEEGTAERLERITVKVEDYRLPPQWSKFLTRRCVGNSAGKWDVVLMCPQGRRYRTKAEINVRLLEPDGQALLPYQKCLEDFSVHRKLARRLGWDTTTTTTTSDSPATISVDALKMKTKVMSLTKPRPVSGGLLHKRPYFRKHKLQFKNRPFVGSKAKTLGPGPKQKTFHMQQSTSGEGPGQNACNESWMSAPSPLPTPVTPPQPLLEEGFIYVGSLKVEIIGTLLRCPKEGCFKNFRKDNLLQMHIKHYHPEMIELLGDTPNVADLAYARTVVEDAPPLKAVEKAHRGREKRVSSATTPKHQVEPCTPELPPDLTSPPVTPKKEVGSAQVLEQSPKLRTLLLESKADSPFKTQQNDVEDMLKTFKIKQESDGVGSLKLKLEKTSSGKIHKVKQNRSVKPDKELTKSQVMALINKIAESEGGGGGEGPSRNHSPADNTFHIKTKKKRRHHPEEADADFKPSSSGRKKKKSSSYLDIWDAPPTDTKPSISDTLAEGVGVGVGDPLPHKAKAEQAHHPDSQSPEPEDNQTFINDNGEKIKIVHMKREEIINCYCGFGEEDGLMIQCELCLCWQHAVCHGIEKESQVPDKYICHICLYPPRGRKSQRYLNSQDWLYEGRLPRVDHQKNAADPNVLNGVAPLSAPDHSRAQALKKSHQLCGNLLHVTKILHSLRCKIDISQKKDHPKLYLWSKPWDDKARPALSTRTPTTGCDTNMHLKEEPLVKSEGDGEGEGAFLDTPTADAEEMMVGVGVGPYSDINIDEVKLEVGESIEVSEVNEMDDNGITDVNSEEQSGMLSSPGGTPIHLPITQMELKTLVKSVQMCAPQPEAAIDPWECRQRLLNHIENIQMLVDARLDSIEAQIAELESQDPSLADDETPECCPRTKQTMQMLMRDLQTLEELGSLV